jgi:hypothetical protein
MTSTNTNPGSAADYTLDIFCDKGKDDAWRIYAWPGWLPGFLRNCFDKNWEAYPVYIDLEELDRQMESSDAEYEKTFSTNGSVQLKATGLAATVLAVWLSQSFASGQRSRTVDANAGGSVAGSGMTE